MHVDYIVMASRKEQGWLACAGSGWHSPKGINTMCGKMLHTSDRGTPGKKPCQVPSETA